MRLKRIRSVLLAGALAAVPLVAGGCGKGRNASEEQAPGSSVRGTSRISAFNNPGTGKARSARGSKRGGIISGGNSMTGSMMRGSSLGGDSLRAPDTDTPVMPRAKQPGIF